MQHLQYKHTDLVHVYIVPSSSQNNDKMDFHAAMETFAEAWVAANTPTAVNTDTQNPKPAQTEELPTLVNKDPNKLVEPVPGPPHGHSTDSSSSGAKSIPIHCVIEQTSGPVTFESNEGASHTTVELDSYAILPSTTLFSAIQIKNWKPLLFDVITNDTKATIEDILGELTQVATLRIRLCSKSKLSTTDEVKDKLLQLLLTQSQGLLVNSGCPIEKTLLSSISKGETYDNLSPEVRRAFDKWYEQQINKQSEKMPEQKEMPRPAHDTPVDRSLVRNSHTPPSDLSTNRQHIPSSAPSLTPPLMPHGKTRMRTSFDPENEIPRLQKWFSDNQHPTREQMIHYLDELNRLDSRKGRRPLDLTNIIYWFKNARAAHRRASKNYDDSSFEMEEGLEGSPGAVDSNLPYLPNKNAVYIVPYPFHGPYMSNNLPHDSKEPCDLSQSRKSTSTPIPASSPAPVKQEPYSQENNPLPEDTPCKRLEDETVENEDHENFNNQSNVKYDEQSEDNFEDQKENGNTEEKMEVNHNGQKEALSGESQNVPPVKKEDTENSETCSNHLLNGALNDEKRLINDDS
ncbi:hypothetical protein KUTeg_000843 [Tegillarca granosa]|uniref:Uncharacterized protein n=1 Tax=Tegillarca granosa TaxID=220873 RepID=A0ABQ9FYP9_TEGGR|nr:hypothetical protein KUTeg_000843 [Tegillarca granosa]